MQARTSIRTPGFSRAAVKSAVIAALTAFATVASGQEFKILVSEPDGPNFQQCKTNFDAVYARETATAQRAIEVLDERIRDIKEERRKLLDNRLFWGLGPKADSDEAMQITQVLHNIKTISDIATTLYESANPAAGILGRYVPGKITALNIYNTLRSGQFINDVVSAEGLGELLWVLTTNLADLRPDIALLASVGENLKEAYENRKAWEGYRDGLRAAIDALDRQLDQARQRIRQEERRIYEEMREGFDKFCAEQAPPRAEDDRFIARQGETVLFPLTSNDRDPDGGRVRVVELRTSSGEREFRGKASIDTSQTYSGMLRYVAPDDFVGTETLTYVIVDDEGERATARVEIEVLGDGRVASGAPQAVSESGVGGSEEAAEARAGAANRVDIDAIWENCRNSTDIVACIDAGLAGQSRRETGRIHPGCRQTAESIAADQRELARLQQLLSRPASDPDTALDQAMARQVIESISTRIRETRQKGRELWKCP